MKPPLPIDDALPVLLQELRQASSVVLRAPAGAGKTTRVPPAILDSSLADSRQILMLQPDGLPPGQQPPESPLNAAKLSGGQLDIESDSMRKSRRQPGSLL